MPGDDRPIGMFDSGFGGLTVARALIDLLPDEHLVYVGDTDRYPYGSKPQGEVRGFAHQIARYLVDRHNTKLLIVACNTASAAVACDELAAACGVPVIGVIEAGVRALVSATATGRVGVIATVGTIGSGAYQTAVGDTGVPVELSCAACPGFVEFVERGQIEGDEVTVLAERLLAPIREAKVDTLLLGCTHYPFLARVVSSVLGPEVVLVSSAEETAFDVRSRLQGSALARRPGGSAPVRRFLSSGDVSWFKHVGQRLFGPELASAEGVTWQP